jgi:AcrR family transcriptional regulator
VTSDEGCLPDAAARLRSDAGRNRARILEVARETFAQDGLDAALTEIARRADVGIATLYRRFPTRDDLVQAVFATKMTAYADAAESALEVPDPWVGFAGYVRTVCEMQAGDAGFADVLALTPDGAFAQEQTRAYRAFVRLIRRAQDAGALRADFVSQDLVMVLMANAGVLRATQAAAPDTWKRLVAYLLESFRAPGRGVLPPAPASADLVRAMQSAAPDRVGPRTRVSAAEPARVPDQGDRASRAGPGPR